MLDLEIIVIVLLSISLIGVLVSNDKPVRKLNEAKKDQNDLSQHAREKAIQIIEDANDQAAKIIESAKADGVAYENELNRDLEEINRQHLSKYKDILQNISNDIKEHTLSGMGDFRKALEAETMGSQKEVAEKIRQEFLAAQRDIQDYKSKMMEKMEGNIGEIMEHLVRKLIGKVVNFDTQKQLIKEALEEAKKEHVI